MYALTIHQPWAGAIAHHGKHVENRVWTPPAAAIGQRLLIHAGAQRDPYALVNGPEFEVQRAIVAVATLAGTHRGVGCCHPWGEPDVWHWELTDVQPLARPVTAKGRQRLWHAPADALAAVADQIGATR